jgi:hypothetical protein
MNENIPADDIDRCVIRSYFLDTGKDPFIPGHEFCIILCGMLGVAFEKWNGIRDFLRLSNR